jgi:hypothetical protein
MVHGAGAEVTDVACCYPRRTALPSSLPTRPLGKAHLATSKEDLVTTRGVVYIHAAPPALCPHVEWAVGGVLGMRVTLDWTPQPTAPGTFRAELSWQADPGTASKLASALRDWMHLRFEVTEEPSAGAEGERYSSTPTLGLFHATTGVHGDIMVREDRLRAALARAATESAIGGAADGATDGVIDPATRVMQEMQALLGKAWDDELEPFRYAGDGAPVRWLHQVV